MFAPRRTPITFKRHKQRGLGLHAIPARLFAAASLCLFSAAFLSGCSLVQGADVASLDLRHVTIDGPDPIRTGDEVTFVVNFSNRAEEDRQFRCKIEPGGREVVVTAPALSDDRDSEIVWPTLPEGRHKVMCGITSNLEEAEIFSLTKEFTVEKRDEAAESSSPSGLSLVRIAVIENHRIWNGKLIVKARFDNRGRAGGWIRCATSPASQGSQFARITREKQGVRVFEFIYPENLSARYTVMCTAHKTFADGPVLKAKSFYVGL